MPEILPNWHPIIVHFAVALLASSAVLFLFGAIFAHRAGRAATVAARWNLGLGLVFALGALVTGWQAYNSVAHDDPSHVNMTIHMRWAIATVVLFVAVVALAWRDRRRAFGGSLIFFVALVPASTALAVTGWYGAENVYRYGLGVMSLPQAGAHHHHHEGDEHHDHAHDEPEGDGGAPPR